MGLGENAEKATLYSPVEARAMPAPTPKSPEKREFVVDSGDSTWQRPVGEVRTVGRARENVHDLDLFATVQSHARKKKKAA